jgi:HAD superfamily hydrolase (TIGR01509 family)
MTEPEPNPEPISKRTQPTPALIFDLDGTLVDSVYQHVLAWRQALEAEGIELSVWRIHRRIGMSGGLFVNALLRELGHPINREQVQHLGKLHAEFFAPLAAQVRPLRGAKELLQTLTDLNVPWAIATSGHMRSARPALEMLGVLDGPAPVITRDLVEHAKPDPDLFIAAADKLGVDVQDAWIIGDSIWDLLAARRARALGIGFRSGGYGDDELKDAGAYRVYDDPADLLLHLDEIGVRRSV